MKSSLTNRRNSHKVKGCQRAKECLKDSILPAMGQAKTARKYIDHLKPKWLPHSHLSANKDLQ